MMYESTGEVREVQPGEYYLTAAPQDSWPRFVSRGPDVRMAKVLGARVIMRPYDPDAKAIAAFVRNWLEEGCKEFEEKCHSTE